MMHELTIDDLKQLLLDGRRAARYAWEHYEELAAREAVYTLYGPYDYGIGAGIPGKLIPKRSRNLTLKTRRKKYIIYELDSEYKLLRTNHVFNSVCEATYHCFELDGIQYAYPFAFNQKKIDRDEVLAIGFQNGKPQYFGVLCNNNVIAQFFDHISPEKMLVTAYFYYPASKYTRYGHPTDLNAPIGALNSAGHQSCWEEESLYTDFSQWFKKEDDSAAET